ncbi:DNA repair protein RadC [Caldithrix abyssi]|nr:DNA repair protein RadC [Caldithrix abyssi]
MKRILKIRDKYMKYGLSVVEDVEIIELLLALDLDSKNHKQEAENLFNKYGSLCELIDASKDLTNVSDLPEQYLFGLRLPHEIANKYLSDKLSQKPIINSAQSLVSYLNHSMRGLKTEHFKILYLNGRNMLMADEYISKGSLTTAAIYPREVMKSALKHNAAALIFAHNHPSGNPNPSQDDLRITKTLCDAANLLEIQVHDHIIVAGKEYYSFADKGLI